MEVIAFISFFLGASWDFFTEVNVPGFDFSFAALFIGLFLASLGLRFVFMMLGISTSADDFHFMRSLRGSKEKGLTVSDRPAPPWWSRK